MYWVPVTACGPRSCSARGFSVEVVAARWIFLMHPCSRVSFPFLSHLPRSNLPPLSAAVSADRASPDGHQDVPDSSCAMLAMLQFPPVCLSIWEHEHM
jgi:hypothetical protein